MCLQKRDLFKMALLTLVTLGFYFLYWAVKTKDELRCLGAQIPTGFCIIIPIANLYFWFRYSEGFVRYVKEGSEPIAYFLLLALMPFVGMFVVQYRINQVISPNEQQI